MQCDLQIDCEFTLALNNRTGKYFFCRDMIKACADLISRQMFWRLPSATVPPRLISRILGRLASIEVALRTWHPWTYRVLPAMRRRRPMLFTDPRECVLYKLRRYDVVLCHDMGPLTHPELYAPGVREIYSVAFERIKAACPLIMFVSEASKNDFVRLYGESFPLLSVAHPPIRSGLDNAEEEAIPTLPSRFLLSVGSVGARKNHARAIAAFAMSGLADEGWAYVICGGLEPGADDVEVAARSTKGVYFCGYVNDAQLRWLYRHARGFVLPSILEGFGLPAAEAINHALVPLVGVGGALHEVTGDAAVLVDPLDVNQIASGMRKLVTMDDQERATRLADMKANISRFSIEAAVSTWRKAIQLSIANWRAEAAGLR